MANKYWVGTGSWFDDDNWSASSGGAGGDGVPTSADDVIFDSAGTSDCNIDEAENITINSLSKINSANISIDEAAAGAIWTIADDCTLQGTGTFTVNANLTHYHFIVKGDFLDQNSTSVGFNNCTISIYGDCTLSANFDHTHATSSYGVLFLYGSSKTLVYASGTRLHILSIEGTYTCSTNVALAFSNSGTGSSLSRLQVNGTFNWINGRSSVALYGLHIFGTLVSNIGIIFVIHELKKFGTFTTTDETTFYFHGGEEARIYPGDYSDMIVTVGTVNSDGEELSFSFDEGVEYSFGTLKLNADTYAFNVDFNGSTYNVGGLYLTSGDEVVTITFNSAIFNIVHNTGSELSYNFLDSTVVCEDMETATFNFSSTEEPGVAIQLFIINMASGANELGTVNVNNSTVVCLTASTRVDELNVFKIETISLDGVLMFSGYDVLTIESDVNVEGIVQFQDGTGDNASYVNIVNALGDFKVGNITSAEITAYVHVTPLELNVTGDALVRYSKVSNIDASGGSAIETLYCTDLGDNVNWDFDQSLELTNPEDPTLQYSYVAVRGGLLTTEIGIPLKVNLFRYAPETVLNIYGRASSGDFELLKSYDIGTTQEFTYYWLCLRQSVKYFWYVTLVTPTETVTSDIENFTVQTTPRNRRSIRVSCGGHYHNVVINSPLVFPNFARSSVTGAAVVPAITLINSRLTS